MKKKILVFGATGMAGHIMYFYLENTGKYELANAVFRTPLTPDSLVADVSDPKAVKEIIESVHPDIVINCIGVLVKDSKQHPERAILLNAYFPHFLKKLCDRTGTKLIHISTDCVFSGKKGNYKETDFRDADDVYGRSKALGEIVNDKDLTIRTSIIGPELKVNGEGLFHWFMHQSGTVNGFKTALWGGVTTLELAKAVDAAVDAGLSGLVQLSNGEGICKYDLLNLFREIWQKEEITVVPYDGNGVDKSIARSERFGYPVPGYREMLLQMHAWMEQHPELYKKIYGC